jgi:hypothetical protein
MYRFKPFFVLYQPINGGELSVQLGVPELANVLKFSLYVADTEVRFTCDQVAKLMNKDKNAIFIFIILKNNFMQI